MRTFHETSLHETAANAASIADADTPLIVAHALHSAGPSPNTGHRPVGTHRDASAAPHLRPTLTRITQTAHDDLTHIPSPGRQHTGRNAPIPMRTFHETSLHESAANAASIADADTPLIVAHALHSAGPSPNTGHRPVGTHRDASAAPHTRQPRQSVGGHLQQASCAPQSAPTQRLAAHAHQRQSVMSNPPQNAHIRDSLKTDFHGGRVDPHSLA